MVISPLEQFDVYLMFPKMMNLHIEYLLMMGFISSSFWLSQQNKFIYLMFWKLYTFVNTIISQNLMNKTQYLPLFYILFLTILSLNLIGMFPYHFTMTSHFMMMFTIAFIMFAGFNIKGVYYHGIHLLSLLSPSGAPIMSAPFLMFIETLSYFARMISLATRLFANSVAGHTLLKILSNFSFSLLKSLKLEFSIVGLFPIIMVSLILGLEFIIAFLQAYMFITLLMIYLNDVEQLH